MRSRPELRYLAKKSGNSQRAIRQLLIKGLGLQNPGKTSLWWPPCRNMTLPSRDLVTALGTY